MKNFLKNFLICLIFFGLVYVLADEPLDISKFLDKKDFPDQVREAEPAIYKFVKRTQHGEGGGTGFFITPHLFVTNFHVVRNLKSFDNAYLRQENQKPIQIKRPVVLSAAFDLAILETKTPSSSFIDYNLFSNKKLGGELFVIGYKGDKKRYYKTTKYIEFVFKDIFFSASVNYTENSSGMSGSPILNSQGEVLGVLSVDNDGNIIRGVNAKYINHLLDGRAGTQCESQIKACVDQELRNIKEHLKKDSALETDQTQAFFYHSVYYLLRNIFTKNEELLDAVSTLARRGHMGAQFNMAAIYHFGHGVEINNRRAVHWLEQVALQGEVTSESNIGNIYFEGLDEIKQDYEKALYWLKKAADKDHSLALFRLGRIYYEGAGTQEDFKKSIELLKRSAYLGHVPAFFVLALIYKEGEVVERDLEKAKKFNKLGEELYNELRK